LDMLDCPLGRCRDASGSYIRFGAANRESEKY
jgi:hypothetical protein